MKASSSSSSGCTLNRNDGKPNQNDNDGEINGASASTATSNKQAASKPAAEDAAARRRRLFGDCALIEIIHLHDCLRGAITELEKDVMALSQSIAGNQHGVAQLEHWNDE